MRKLIIFALIAVLFSGTSCFRSKQGISVIGYRNQMVFLKKNVYYKVGELPKGWDHIRTSSKAASFYNESIKGTVSTDAFCGSYFEDLPLKTLTNQLFAGTNRAAPLMEKDFILDGRGAFRSVSTGKVDGVPLKFDSVVIKKNNCTIDLVYIVPPENYESGVGDFEVFFGGFKF